MFPISNGMNRKFLGIDFGMKNIGIALSDDGGSIAFPRAVLARSRKIVAEIKVICGKEKVEEIVVGASLDLQGRPNPLMAHIAPFVSELQKECGLPVSMEPEFFTSAQAERFRKNDEPVDASAAALILQSFLDKRRERAKKSL